MAAAALSSSAATSLAFASTGAATDGVSSALKLELAAGLQLQLQSIALRFGVSADVALREFVRFLEIKQWTQDSEHTKISPTPLMDAEWHAALLETKLYAKIQQHLGMALHHSASGAASDPASSAARESRLTTMRHLYAARYNEQPVEDKEDAVAVEAPAQASAPSQEPPAASAASSAFPPVPPPVSRPPARPASLAFLPAAYYVYGRQFSSGRAKQVLKTVQKAAAP
jgi:hypothetical protein